MSEDAVLVYRVENPSHNYMGPFKQTKFPDISDRLCNIAEYFNLKPPYRDGIKEVPWCFVFGSPSLDSLKKWFLPDGQEFFGLLEDMHRVGFVLSTYLVYASDVIMSESGMQVAFDPNSVWDGRAVEHQPLTDLVNL